jgi:APA family basic amino acid/polyamine antiporter
MIPIAGSAHTYGYATLGEFVAWIIGWDLIRIPVRRRHGGRAGAATWSASWHNRHRPARRCQRPVSYDGGEFTLTGAAINPLRRTDWRNDNAVSLSGIQESACFNNRVH